MTAPHPISCYWNGEALAPTNSVWKRRAAERLAEGEIYSVEVREMRSLASHNHYFASIAEAHANLPEEMAERWATPDHLRRYALIHAGYRDERSFACASKAEAVRIAAFVRPMDDYAVVVVRESVVIVLTAKSQSMKAMGKAEFQKSKDAVLDYVAGLIGTDATTLNQNVDTAA